MKEYKFICQYCGTVWKKEFYSKPDLSYIKCPKCQDSNIVVKTEKVNYYE